MAVTSSIATDLEPDQMPDVLRGIEVATSRIVEQLPAHDKDWWDGPSALEGWSRRTLLAHLHYGAEASRVVTLAALDDRPVDYYPGGVDQRAWSLAAFDDRPMPMVANDVTQAVDRLAETWADVEPEQWNLDLTEPRLGPMKLSRFAALRSCEVEVHGADLDAGLDWSPEFVQAHLPLRVAWLPGLHAKPEADRSIRLSWVLAGEQQSWLAAVDDDGPRIEVLGAAGSESAEATHRIERDDKGLVEMLLGRPAAPGPAAPPVLGEPSVASFKAAFPGP